MKTLLFLRHGKTEERAPGGDRDRALTKRGIRDSEAMGRFLGTHVGCPDVIISSDAKRAFQTAALVAPAGGCASKIATDPKIYLSDVDGLIKVVRKLPEEAESVLLVGHNPAFEGLANMLAEAGTPARHLPTAGLVHLEFDVARWNDVRPGGGVLRGFFSPDELEEA